MICVDYPCDDCIHKREKIDDWKPACDAFPEGTPDEFLFRKSKEIKECNNGIGYEPKENNKK